MLESAVILVAEDNPDDVFLIRRALQKSGFSGPVQFVEDGAAVVDYLSGAGKYADRALHPLPHFAFLDIQMASKSGLDALAWLRQQPAFQHIPVMIVSLSAFERDIKRAHELGASSYVVKPATLDELAREFKRFYMHWWPLANSACGSIGKQFRQLG